MRPTREEEEVASGDRRLESEEGIEEPRRGSAEDVVRGKDGRGRRLEASSAAEEEEREGTAAVAADAAEAGEERCRRPVAAAAGPPPEDSPSESTTASSPYSCTSAGP
jgi:hypothetical protein